MIQKDTFHTNDIEVNTMVTIGKPAPASCLPDKDRNETCLENFRGNWVVLYFYPKDNTSGCTLEAMDFTAAAGMFEKEGATILGISPDSPESHCNFYDKHDLGIRLLSDTGHEVLEKYGAWQKKKMYGKEFMGVVRTTFLIDPEGNVAHIWPKVKVQGHVDAVLEKLKELKG